MFTFVAVNHNVSDVVITMNIATSYLFLQNIVEKCYLSMKT